MQDTDIPVKILKENAEYFAEYICLQFNEAICAAKFPASFRLANITPVFKQGSRNQRENYRPISILPIISKIFEKLILRQLSNHFDSILLKFQCGFRKGYCRRDIGIETFTIVNYAYYSRKLHLCKPKNNTPRLYFVFAYFLHCNRYPFWTLIFFFWLTYLFLIVIDHCEEKLALWHIVKCCSVEWLFTDDFFVW